MTRSTRIGLVSRVASAVAILALLIWGSYAILLTQISPDQAGIAYDLTIEPQISLNPANATISPGAEAQYIMTFESNIPIGVPPTARERPGGLGYSFGPDPIDTTNNATFPHTTTYAVFTFLFGWQLGPSGGPIPTVWVSSPSGVSYQPTIQSPGYSGVDAYAKQAVASFNQHIGWITWPLEVDTVGNYTLHFLNSGVANAIGLVSMEYVDIVFSRSNPFLYAGIATIIVGIAAGAVIGLGKLKGPRNAIQSQKLHPPDGGIPTDSSMQVRFACEM